MRGTGILINDNYDLQVIPLRDGTGKIVSGLQVGNTLFQNQALILICHRGEIKESPLLGVGIEDTLLDESYDIWRRKITMQMEMDNQKVKNVQFSKKKKLLINAKYNS